MDIVFCVNKFGLIGLGATVLSLLRNCSDSKKLTLWFLCADFSSQNKLQLTNLLETSEFNGKFKLIDFDPKIYFGSFTSLHGDWTAYGRLLIANTIMVDRILYLDSDLIVEVDVLSIEDFNFNNYILAAVGGGKFKYTLGNKFYIDKIGISPEEEYFNSGVLLLNLRLWRRLNITDRCIRIAKQYSFELPSHDQSLLNIICAGKFAKLPSAFNCEWGATHQKPCIADNMIIHFVGSPKPWDPFGSFLHNGYMHWHKYFDIEWMTTFKAINYSRLVRLWNIRRSYMRCLSEVIRYKI